MDQQAKHEPPPGWKELAWNGVCVAIPPGWEPGRIGPRHLIVESEAGPAMEIKWGRVRGRFLHRTHLKRLRKLTGARGANARECRLPAEWKPALAQFDPSGFCWSAGGAAATGAILFCPRSRTGGLVQFFHAAGDRGFLHPAGAVLQSLRFQGDAGVVRWAVFDIRAQLPERFALVRHRFEPGRFVLSFAADRCRLDLYRWAPAAVLLKDSDLTRFAHSVGELAPLRFEATEEPGMAAVEGHRPAAAGIGGRLARRLGLHSVCRARLWHLPERNRILGLRMQARAVIEPGLWRMVNRTYGLVDV
ncbi:MAG: hypothetical protein MUD16_03830 [Desulfobacterales bacterium]|jgi:hypothetical protein|nr:hypothetical protein [Desulfobacterales bacterium]